MASINGISVKKMTQFYGHEGESLYQGNLYLNNKKIGFWSQDSRGGPDQFYMEGAYSEKLLNAAVTSRNPDKAITGGSPADPYEIPYDMDLLLYDYIKLTEDEKYFKKAVKGGYTGVLIATDGYHMAVWNLPESYTTLSDADLLEKMGPAIANEKAANFFKENKHTKHTIKIYRSSKDFIIGDPIPTDEIIPKKDLNNLITGAKKNLTQKEEQGTTGNNKETDFDL